MKDIQSAVKRLILYGKTKGLIHPLDQTYIANCLIELVPDAAIGKKENAAERSREAFLCFTAAAGAR